MNTFRDRVAPLIVSGVLLAYLIYVLLVREQTFSTLHLGAFALVTLLVLVPFVTKIKIPNVIELETKLKQFQEHTDQEIDQLRNAISSVTNIRMNPMLNQFTILGSETQFRQMVEALKSTPKKDEIVGKDEGAETERTRFLHQTRCVADDAQMALKVARVIQIAYEKKRKFKDDQADLGPEDPFEKTKFLIECMIQGGLKYFVPEEEQPIVIKQLETYRKLDVIYSDVYNYKRKPPELDETDNMVGIVGEMTTSILAGIALFSVGAVVTQRRIADAIPYLKRGVMPPFEPDGNQT